jgi:hypothetical protein
VVDASGRLLANLAGERYHAWTNSNSNLILVLTVHRGGRIQKWSDGRYLVVSLPAIVEGDYGILRAYADTFNGFETEAMNKAVRQGRYGRVAEFYRVLLHFRPPDEEDFATALFKRRLELLEKLAAGQNVETNLREFWEAGKTEDGGQPLVDFSGIQMTSAARVKSVLEVPISGADGATGQH